MVASAADDGVAPAVAEASTKLLTAHEVDELEAEYAIIMLVRYIEADTII